MKLFIVLCICIAAIQANKLAEKQQENVKTYKTDCQTASGVSGDLVEKTNNGDFSGDVKLKEYFFCLSKKLGFLNEAGDFQMTAINDKITANHGQETAREVVAPCTQKKASSGPETSINMAKCFYEKSKKHITLA
ncbi:PREDICTED: uncharacterized protein LOC108567223 [Nicrophorus vespilloides]|uniref:Uncharacterized protein LOC108567223 n=1 Tax=Nicrophorus vespilloides TaxID=110193 RepID=A0ABM1N898_NICVS|nr:PREDICTED: uncharacterized protein LOC108567223 [Nicrophorus vespilloides]